MEDHTGTKGKTVWSSLAPYKSLLQSFGLGVEKTSFLLEKHLVNNKAGFYIG